MRRVVHIVKVEDGKLAINDSRVSDSLTYTPAPSHRHPQALSVVGRHGPDHLHVSGRALPPLGVRRRDGRADCNGWSQSRLSEPVRRHAFYSS